MIMHTAAAMTNIHPITANPSMIMTTIPPITTTITTITIIPIQMMTNIQKLIVNLAIHITITTTTIKITMIGITALIINI